MISLLLKKVVGSPITAYALSAILVFGAIKFGFLYVKHQSLTKDVAELKADLDNMTAEKEKFRIMHTQLDAVRNEEHRRYAMSTAEVTKLTEAVQRLNETNSDLEGRIDEYSKTPAANDCELDTDWVLLHNEATGTPEGRMSESGDRSVVEGTPSPTQAPVSASKTKVLNLVSDNYLMYKELSQRYMTLLGVCTNQESFSFQAEVAE